jgi:D-alanyl-D-alanine carboxypeptidase/D-alanyl-D-alanine-endopeptidase (penicillin-binding protein 4)
VKAALGGATPSKVIVDATLFTGPMTGAGWAPSDITDGTTARITALMTDDGRSNPTKGARYARPDLGAGQAFAKLLGVPTTAVVSGSAPAGSAEPASPQPLGSTASPSTAPEVGGSGATGTVSPGQLLGTVYSPPLLRMIEMMLSASDNTMADMLVRQVALATGGEASFAGAASAVLQELGKLGLTTTGANLVDGSGLSNLDRLTPQLLTGVLGVASAPAHPELHGLLTGLPVAGYSGTLSGRYRSPNPSASAGIGEVRAKTGTLTGVSALAGVVVDTSGRLLGFAISADQVPVGGTAPAEMALDRVAAALAALG